MATGTITNRSVEALRPAEKDAFLWDDEVSGFGLKVTPGGAKSYVLSYRLGGRESPKRRHTIGRHGVWTPIAARQEAKRLKTLVDQGIDPADEKKQRRREAVELEFSGYAELFIERCLKAHWQGGWALAAGLIRRGAVPVFKGRSIKQITRADIAALMDRLAHSPATARNTFAALRKMFKWAVSRGDIEASPMRDLDPPAGPPSRDRVLSDKELALVWSGAERLGYPFGPLFQLLLLTGQRRSEVAGMEWKELNRTTQIWTIPAARAKNNKVSDVPLSAAAIEVLDAVAGIQSGSRTGEKLADWPRRGWVFSATGQKPVTGYSVAKQRLDKEIGKLTAEQKLTDHVFQEPWRNHDLRRAMATGLQRMGVRLEVTEAVLNHVSGSRSGIVGVYQRYQYGVEKREALDLWSAHVMSLRPGPDS